MPELPEVETVRRDLSRVYAGDKLARIVVTGRRTVRRHSPDALAALDGQVLSSVGRLGKYLWLEWEDGHVLVAHLRMSGQMLAVEPGAPTEPHTHAVFYFSRGELRFVDPRTFGELFLASPLPDRDGTAPAGPPAAGPSTGARVAELAHLGPDALVAEAGYLKTTFAGRRGPLKSLLVDQRVLAGIGNIYADEICFEAKVRPDRPGGSLKSRELQRVAASTRSVLGAAISLRGSTLADQQYSDLFGAQGGYQSRHNVYGRLALPCTSCGVPVQRVRFGAKSAFWCPRCQR
jgi:formamidopyrimidine-DNA glycosylase